MASRGARATDHACHWICQRPIVGIRRAIAVVVSQGLEEEGYAAGRNIAVQYRFSDGDDSRLPAIAADFVRRQVAVIVASGPSAVVVKGATSTIPIVFSSGDDPVGRGLVASLNRPGGNATGVVVFSNELGPKRLGLLRELAPKAGLIAFVVNLHSTTTAAQVKDIQTAAAALDRKSWW